jgi:hypothetical protein
MDGHVPGIHSRSAKLAKIITAEELAGLVVNLIMTPEALGQDMIAETFSDFVSDIAQVVCDYCGGEVHRKAEPIAGDMGKWTIEIRGNDSMPEGGGVWAAFDPEGEL